MIAREVLELVSKLQKGDKEMIELAESIFIENNPTPEDVDELNNINGYPPIMRTLEKTYILDAIAQMEIEADIFDEDKTLAESEIINNVINEYKETSNKLPKRQTKRKKRG